MQNCWCGYACLGIAQSKHTIAPKYLAHCSFMLYTHTHTHMCEQMHDR